MLSTVELDYVQHLERGYCVNHPDVIAQTKDQVVDRAVKQLLEALQANGFELDADILKCGNGWLQYDAGTSAWQYSNDAGVTWLPLTQGVLDHTELQNIGTNTHAQIDTHLAAADQHNIIGEIKMLSHPTVPTGWLVCDGQTILRSSALGQLYGADGYPYGFGNGTTTCNLPDLRYRFPWGANLLDQIGDTGGSNLIQLTTKELPAHQHSLAVPYSSIAGTENTFMRGGTPEGTISLQTGSIGDDGSLEHYPPFLTLLFIVYAGV